MGKLGAKRQKKPSLGLMKATLAIERQSTIRHAISKASTTIVLVFAIYASMQMVKDLAGTQTHAEFIVHVLSSGKGAAFLGLTWGGVSWWNASRQKRLRKNVIEREHGRIQQLERDRDPDRSSSGLTKRGDTPPKQ